MLDNREHCEEQNSFKLFRKDPVPYNLLNTDSEDLCPDYGSTETLITTSEFTRRHDPGNKI
jgi:hypothetical protein